MKKRTVYLDIIRIIAAYLVIFTHTSDLGSRLYVFREYSEKRTMLYIMSGALSCICVPLFFMVSGALMLAKEETYTQIFKKRILRYIFVIVGISYFYYVFYNNNNWLDIYCFFQQTYSGTLRCLLWFLYAYVGYLISLPFLRKMVKNLNETDFRYLFLIGILFKGGLDVFGAVSGLGNVGVTCVMAENALFYPIMGYYLANVIENRRDNRKILLVAGGALSLLCILAETLMTIWEKNQFGLYTENYLSTFNIVPTLYVFFVVKNLGEHLQKYDLACKVIGWMGDCTFGVYLIGLWLQMKMVSVYYFVLEHLQGFPLISSFIYVFIVLVVGILLISVLKLIPGLKKII